MVKKSTKFHKHEKEKRKAPWLLGTFVLILFTVLILLQTSNLWKNLAVDSTSDVLFLYVFSSLNFVAFVIFAFIFGRSLLKLLQERRELQIGSKIKTRLLIYFVAIILLPLIVMPVFSYLFMNRAMDRWFTQTPEDVIRKAGYLQQRTAQEQTIKFIQTTEMLAESFEGQNIQDANLRKIISKGDFVMLELVSQNLKVIASAEKSLTKSQRDSIQKIETLIRQGKLKDNDFNGENKFKVAISELSDGRKLIAVSDVSSMENLSQTVQDALVRLDDQKTVQLSIRRNGLLILGFVSFLLIFAASWMARYVSKGLTRPILALIEGADEITQGNLGYQVDIFADDELAMLIKAFNEMSGKLDENAEELKERRRYIETVLQSLSTGVISFDDSNRLTTINKAAIRMLKLGDVEFINFDLNQLVSRENEFIFKKLIKRSKRMGKAAEQAFLCFENTNGNSGRSEELPVSLAATALPDENGVVLMIEDLSDLIAAQRASAWQEVAQRMAHEIKNPLTPIQLSAERIAKHFRRRNGNRDKRENELQSSNSETFSTNDKNVKVVEDGTETILREVSSLKSMVDEFSNFARLPEIKLKRGSLNTLIQQAVRLYEGRAEDVKLETDLAENLPSVLIDEEQLKQVFVNLIDNSIEAFGEPQRNKNVFIKTWSNSARSILVSEVSDNGKGVAPSDFRRVFQPYFSTKGRGTGLGLAIVQRIISEHKGKIKVVSNTPKGTKFIIELPIDA